jgi:aspartate/methionine/tyrosine aminotransferase
LSAVGGVKTDVLIERNLEIVARNLPLLDEFFARHPGVFDWVRPNASPIGFPPVQLPGDGRVDELCRRLAEAGVLLLPGTGYDEPHHVRVGFARADLPEALRVLDERLEAAL